MRGPSIFKRGRQTNRVCRLALVAVANASVPDGNARAHRHLARAHRSLIVCLLAIAAMIVLPAAAQAESLSNAGKEFWLGFPSNCTTACLDTPTYQTLYITGNTATTGTVAIPGLSFS